MKVKIAKWGNSLGLRLPKAAVAEIGLKAGSEVEVTVVGRDLRVRQALAVKSYRLEDLLAEINRLGPEYEPETVDWGLTLAPKSLTTPIRPERSPLMT